jgi:hypothetical protein
MDSASPRPLWHRLTPGRLIIGLLAAECLLWLSDRLAWPAWHKGYAVMMGVAIAGAALAALLSWLLAALLFRCWFQLSLRALLLLAVAVAVPSSWLSVEMRQAATQQQAIKAIVRTDTETWYDYSIQYDRDSCCNDTIYPNREPPEADWLLRLVGIDFLHDVVYIEVKSENFTNSDMELLRAFERLESLFLNCDRSVDDSGLDSLLGLKRLRELIICGPDISDKGLEKLARCCQLRVLCVKCMTVGNMTDAGLEKLVRLSQLRDLDIEGADVTDSGVSVVVNLKRLDHLNLKGTNVTPEGARKLQELMPNCKIDR